MCIININEVQRNIDSIVKEYLFNVSSLMNHDYFNKRKALDSRTKHYKSSGFHILSSETENIYVVNEEMFLEGCTRVFLINPIFKMLMDMHDIRNDWQYGDTFAKYTISNREYELGNFIEFIAVLNDKNVGVRYTSNSYSAEESFVMDRDFKYLHENDNIPGYDNLNHVDRVCVLDWSGISDQELSEINPVIPGEVKLSEDMTVRKFFDTFFSAKEYEIFVATAKIAISKAKEIIALSTVPQLLPNNMLNFKESILHEFVEENMNFIKYEFEDGRTQDVLNDSDAGVINDKFFNESYREALVGDSDFARSFVTSEYLFKIIKSGLSIDYTAVVVGYLKSVEQLLYLLYTSAFEGKSGMKYWDTCNRKQNFDANNAAYRYNPYDVPEKEKMQEEYYHKKKMPDFAPEIGELTRFLRYFNKMWLISEDGKEYVFQCLEDFRKSCRNSHFHKDNIDANEYSKVEKIRNNTYVCLYYLLGAFELLDATINKKKQLGIIDYKFETLYKEIRQKRRRFFDARFADGTNEVICYLNDDADVKFDASGTLINTELRFVKTGMTRDNAFISELNQLMEDKSFIEDNLICLSRNNVPDNMVAFWPKK